MDANRPDSVVLRHSVGRFRKAETHAQTPNLIHQVGPTKSKDTQLSQLVSTAKESLSPHVRMHAVRPSL